MTQHKLMHHSQLASMGEMIGHCPSMETTFGLISTIAKRNNSKIENLVSLMKKQFFVIWIALLNRQIIYQIPFIYL